MTEAAPPAPDDLSIRAEVTHPARSYLVQAPAGAGKTTLLVQRYLRLLAQANQPEEIVAVTFTVAATAEMRKKILRQLGPEADDPYAAAAQTRDRDLGWGLRETPARLRIMTFDALALALVSRMPWRAHLGPAPRPSLQPRNMYLEAAQRALSSQTPPARVMLELGRARAARLAEDLADLLATRDQWLPVVAQAQREPDLRAALEEEIGRRRIEFLERTRTIIQAAGGGDLLPRMARQAAAWAAGKKKDMALLACRDLHGLPAATEADWDCWMGLADLLLTNANKPRHGQTLGLSKEETAQTSPSPELVAALVAIRKAPPAELSERDWRAIPALLGLLDQLGAQLRSVFAERGECDFTAITAAAVEALGGEASPSDLAFALDGSLRHLLVNEFQDTSPSQFELLRALTREWQPTEDGRTLFLVGDAMQSIYAFRNADVRLFLELVKQAEGGGPIRFGPVALQLRAISSNFRSSEELVNWCADVFGACAPPGGIYVPGVPTRRFERAGVALHSLANDNPRTEAESILDLVREERSREINPKIAILAATRRHVNALLPALATAGIPVRAVNLLRLDQSPVVQDLLALTRALLDPADRVAWLALLRAPWCGLSLADLAALCEAAGDTPVQHLLRSRLDRLSPDGQCRALALLSLLTPALERAGRTPPRALVEWCWHRLGTPWLAPEQRGHATAYFDLLESLTRGGGLLDPDRLTAEAERVFLPPAIGGAGAVNVTTIHQAKGLQYDTVILPGLHCKRSNGGNYNLLLWHVDATTGRLLVANGLAGDLRRFVRRERRADEDAETLRLLYVACTRAQRKLHVTAYLPPTGKPRGDSRLHVLWPALSGQFPAAALAPAGGTPPVAAPPPLRRVPANWAPPEPPDDIRWAPPPAPSRAAGLPAYAGPAARAVGLAVHAMLHRMAVAQEASWQRPRLAALLRALGALGTNAESALAAAEHALARIAANPKGQWILAPHAEAANEVALAGVIDGEARFGVLDRTFIDADGARWVIDYKTTADPNDEQRAAHREQVETYAELLRMRHGGVVRRGIYYLLRDEWVEW